MLSGRYVIRAILAGATLLFPILCARADDSAALKDRLHAAEKDTTLNGEGIAPFYLKLSVQLFDAKGTPAESGTVELYWAGTQKEKRIYSFPSYSATEVHLDGKVFRTSGSGFPPAMAPLLIAQVLHPMAQVAQIDRSEPQMKKVTMGKVQLDCITLAGAGGGSPVSPGFFPNYCFDPADGALRASSSPPSNVILRNVPSTFQHQRIALDVVITAKGVEAAEGKVEKLEERAIADAVVSADGLLLVPPTPLRVASGVVAGSALSHPAPIYPLTAKARHVQGTVVLRVLIGKDGQIHDLQVVSSPDPELSSAAMDAVRGWRYRPFLLGGDPVEVETTININFVLAN